MFRFWIFCCLLWIPVFLFSLTQLSIDQTLENGNLITVYSNLTRLLEPDSANYIPIRERLFSLQKYDLYAGWIDTLPQNNRIIKEKLSISLMLNRTNRLYQDLTNSLSVMEPLEIISYYGSGLSEQDNLYVLLAAPYQEDVFFILKQAALMKGNLTVIDREIFNHPGLFPENAVYAYLSESYFSYPRDIRPIAELYHLTNTTNLIEPLLDSDYLAGRYKTVLEQISNTNLMFQKSKIRNLSEIFSYSLFRTGKYQESLNLTDNLKKTEKLTETRLFCCFALSNWTDASNCVKELNNVDSKKFYSAFLGLFQEKPSLDAFRLYINNNRPGNHFTAESLLFIQAENEGALIQARDTVLSALLYLPESNKTLPDFALAYSLNNNSSNHLNSNHSDNPVYEWTIYQKALFWIQTGNNHEAMSLLNQLIQTNSVSPLVKNLAVYLLRKTDQK